MAKRTIRKVRHGHAPECESTAPPTRERVAVLERAIRAHLAAWGFSFSLDSEPAASGWVHCCNCQGDHAPPACRPDTANRYHQRLGAKWMCEAIARWCRTTLAQNHNAQAFAADVERRWEDDAFWRPETTR